MCVVNLKVTVIKGWQKVFTKFNLSEKGLDVQNPAMLNIGDGKTVQANSGGNIKNYITTSEESYLGGIQFDENENHSFVIPKDAEIPQGYSRYEYKGATLDVYRIKNDYNSQLVHPKNFDWDDFNKSVSTWNLKPSIKTNGVKKLGGDTGGSSNLNINGKIDSEVTQGNTGDCWLIAALYSMSSTEEGKQIIKDAITVNSDNSVTVTFAGLGVSYTITREQLQAYNTDNNLSDSYSNGAEDDVLAMEIATELLMEDIQTGRVQVNSKNPLLTQFAMAGGIGDGGLPDQLVYYLTGVDSQEYYNEDMSPLGENQVLQILNEAYKSGNRCLSFGVYGNGHSAKLTNGETFRLDIGAGGHALAITDITKDTVTFVNPWNTSIKYTMTWKEFAKLNIGFMSSSNLSTTKKADNIVDMTDGRTVNPNRRSNGDNSGRVSPSDNSGGGSGGTVAGGGGNSVSGGSGTNGASPKDNKGSAEETDGTGKAKDSAVDNDKQTDTVTETDTGTEVPAENKRDNTSTNGSSTADNSNNQSNDKPQNNTKNAIKSFIGKVVDTVYNVVKKVIDAL